MLHLLQPHAGVRNARLQEPLMWRWGLVVSILALALIGCSSASQEGIVAEATINPFGVLFPKQVPIPDPQTYPTALLEGKLVVIERCLRVSATEGGTSYLLVWPPDFSLSADRGALIVLNRAGQMLYRQGDTVSIGGGEVPSDEASWLNIPLLRQKPPRECPGPYWLVSPLAQPTPSASDRSVTIGPALSPTPIVTWTPTSLPIPTTQSARQPEAAITVASQGRFISTTLTSSIAPIPMPESACSPSTTIKAPGASHFDPIEGSGAIAYSNDGLALFFSQTKSSIVIHSLTKLGLDGVDWIFAWSPNGTQIAFLYTDLKPEGCARGYLMLADLSHGEVHPLLQSLQRYGQPTWSPDGQWLAFTDDSGRLTVVRVRDGKSMTLSDRATPLHTPAWLDAEHVVYVQRATRSNLGELVSQPVNGSTPHTLLSDVRIDEFALSPNGRYVAYSGGLSELADLQAGTQQDLGAKLTERLQWSPDGQYLLGRGGEAGIYVIRPKVSMDVTQMDFYGVPAPRQSWSPDSQAFAVLVGDDRLPSIGIYRLDKQTLEKTSFIVRPPYALAWSTR